MKKRSTRLFALLLAALMILTACGGGDSSSSGGNDTNTSTPSTTGGDASGGQQQTAEPVKDWYTYQIATSEITSLLTFRTEAAEYNEVLYCLSTPLLEQDVKGKLMPAAAKEWGTDDNGLTWTFKLRDDIVWVDVNGNEMAKCTSADWLTAMEWVLNFWKNDSANTSMPKMMIEGAQEYCDYTKDLDESVAYDLSVDNGPFREMLGIETPDDYTIIYHCTKPCPYFETLCPGAPLRPLPQGMVDAVGTRNLKNIENTNMWYNGPYIMTEFIQANSKTLTKNEAYWDKDCDLFDSVHYVMVDSAISAQNLFMNGEVDWCNLSESNLRTIYDNPNNEWYPYLVESRPAKWSYQIHWNFSKNQDDGETPDDNWNNAISNLAFRKSLFYGLDFTNYWCINNFINPASCENVAYTMKEMIYYPDGTDYVQKVWEKLGYPDGTGRFDMDKAMEYKQQAMSELEGKVQFPVEVDYFISASNQSALDNATILKEMFEALGTDYIVFNIGTYVSSASQEVTLKKRHSFTTSGWGADYMDPENFLAQEIRGDESAAYKRSNWCNEITNPEMIEVYDTFTQMYRDAAAICDDTVKRYDAFAEAEAYMLENVLTLPMNYRINWKLTKSNDYDYMDAFKNWHTSSEPYKTGDYEQFKAEFYGN